MEVRIDNTIKLAEIEKLKLELDYFFKTDFQIIITGDYVYFREE